MSQNKVPQNLKKPLKKSHKFIYKEPQDYKQKATNFINKKPKNL